MRREYTTFPPLNPVFQAFISWFSLHAVDVYESPGHAPPHGYVYLKPPAYPALGRHRFTSFLSRPLLRHQQGHCSRQLQHPSIPPRAD